MRIGNSIDFHKFDKSRDLILGGVKIPYEYGLLGDSDADVVLHSIGEALLGALALGDLGTYYNKKNATNLDSKIILKECYERIKERGYDVSNIDTMIVIEEPNLKPYKDLMKESIANVLNISKDKISIKATTMEKCGIIGRKEGALCMSSVLLEEIK